ncbi:hypothetical protein K2Q16_00105 [Patescibacteria group bacterium]|nr:hypothetical protein [Patescibacteria group bacterium]
MAFTTSKDTSANAQKESWHAPLNKPTSLSKITAAVVVIVLPFFGFFLGVQYAGAVTGLLQGF